MLRTDSSHIKVPGRECVPQLGSKATDMLKNTDLQKSLLSVCEQIPARFSRHDNGLSVSHIIGVPSDDV